LAGKPCDTVDDFDPIALAEEAEMSAMEAGKPIKVPERTLAEIMIKMQTMEL
jgi:hypothetical protein